MTVGLLESATDLLAEPLVSALARDRPGIELRLMTAYSGHLQRWLDDGAPSSPANTCWPAGRPATTAPNSPSPPTGIPRTPRPR
ncbi:type 2 periplasmic-binding domain-containing protein [Streptomyces mirabilis]|uniref:hypothetical protein n=1 Tax=Streptomyces mirabilis TaxID=68239 RepID=UPI003827E74B